MSCLRIRSPPNPFGGSTTGVAVIPCHCRRKLNPKGAVQPDRQHPLQRPTSPNVCGSASERKASSARPRSDNQLAIQYTSYAHRNVRHIKQPLDWRFPTLPRNRHAGDTRKARVTGSALVPPWPVDAQMLQPCYRLALARTRLNHRPHETATVHRAQLCPAQSSTTREDRRVARCMQGGCGEGKNSRKWDNLIMQKTPKYRVSGFSGWARIAHRAALVDVSE